MTRRLSLAALAVALGASGCTGSEPPRVQVAEVVRAPVSEVVEAPGNVAARASATVTAPADATVEAVLVGDGEPVTAGQIVVRLVSESAQERLRAAETAAANAANARVDLPAAGLGAVQDALDAAAQQSFDAGRAAAGHIADPHLRAAAEEQVRAAEQRYAAAAAAARAAIAAVGSGVGSLEDALNAVTGTQRTQAAVAVRAARATVDALTVRAPIDGVVNLGGPSGDGAAPGAAADVADLVGSLPDGLAEQAGELLGGSGTGGQSVTTSGALVVGAQVSSGSPLLTVTDLGGLSVTAEVDETDVLLVEPGVPAQVELDAVPGATYPATVASVDVAPTPSSGGGVAYQVRLALGEGRTGDGEPAPRPKPGMSAVVDLEVRTSPPESLAVPASAVVRDGEQEAVLVVEGGRVERREVRLGAQGEDRVEVVSGLEPGERVVARDADRLSDGDQVRE